VSNQFLVLLIAVACMSAVLTGLMRRYALSRQLLDRPNDRSSHTVPTPRGGGVAIVVAFLLGLMVLGDGVPFTMTAALLCG
jgi:Fuc2NAc and GlcNAc transferase